MNNNNEKKSTNLTNFSSVSLFFLKNTKKFKIKNKNQT